MDSTGSADLLALGSHCSVPDCKQIDFLPFTCDCCGQIFCLEHRTCQAHACQKAGQRETSTIVCPICAKAVKLSADDDPNEAFERHQQQGCDPSNYAKVHDRPRCPAKGCKEKLGAINTYTCKECTVQVCLKHRFPEAHQCKGKPARPSQITQAMRSLWGSKPSPAAVTPQRQQQQQQQQQQSKSKSALAAVLKPQSGQAHQPQGQSQQQKGQSQQQKGQLQQQGTQAQQQMGQQRPQSAQARQQLPTAASRPASAATQQVERCPKCGKGFGTVQELIRHSEAAHQSYSKTSRHGAQDSCPHCGKMFTDPVALVHHVEHSHSNNAQCVLS